MKSASSRIGPSIFKNVNVVFLYVYVTVKDRNMVNVDIHICQAM